MENIDTRTLTQDVQYEKRNLLIKLRNKGMSNREAAELTGFSETHASTLWRKYLKDGREAISKKKRGRKKDDGKVLSNEQERELKAILTDKTPDQVKLKCALWTRDALQELIRLKYKIEVPLRTLTDYLRKWGFTSQKPAKRAYEQQPAVVQKWLDEEYPTIEARAKAEKCEILWGDETGMENTAYQTKGFAPKGKTPVVRLNAKKSRINMVSAISNRGTLRFMFYEEKMNADMLIKFMKRLTKDSKRKVFLILDNLRVHHCKVVMAWLEANKEQIEVFYLPSYSPELNPDEYLNGDLKRHLHSGTYMRDKKSLETKARGYLMKIQRKKQHISNLFNNKHVKYAAVI